MSEIRELTLEELCNIEGFIKSTSRLHDKSEENYKIRHAVIVNRARMHIIHNDSSGTFGLFNDKRLEALMGAYCWAQLPYYTIDNLRSCAKNIRKVLELSEYVVRRMEEKQRYTFYYSKSFSGKIISPIHNLLLAKYVLDRYDVVIEKAFALGNSYSLLKEIGRSKDAVVYRLSLRNSFRPFVVNPTTLNA